MSAVGSVLPRACDMNDRNGVLQRSILDFTEWRLRADHVGLPAPDDVRGTENAVVAPIAPRDSSARHSSTTFRRAI
jgi:hypothetical protein